jgi:mRNA interferase MazF
MRIERGDIVLAALDPVLGHEISKTRPVVVVSNDIGNTFSGTVTVLPVTSGNVEKIYPFEVYIPLDVSGLKKNSKAKADQIRTLDKARLIKRIGRVDQQLIKEIDNAIKVHLALR